jgi:hypothetical protein
MQLCRGTPAAFRELGVYRALLHAGSAPCADVSSHSWEGWLAARRTSHIQASTSRSQASTAGSDDPLHHLRPSQQQLMALRKQRVSQRMESRYRKLTPLQRAAAIAHEDLVANNNPGKCALGQLCVAAYLHWFL